MEILRRIRQNDQDGRFCFTAAKSNILGPLFYSFTQPEPAGTTRIRRKRRLPQTKWYVDDTKAEVAQVNKSIGSVGQAVAAGMTAAVLTSKPARGIAVRPFQSRHNNRLGAPGTGIIIEYQNI